MSRESITDDIKEPIFIKINDSINELIQIWYQIGFSTEQIYERFGNVTSSYESVAINLKTIELNKLNDLVIEREEKSTQINKILSDLNLDPFVLPQTATLIQASELLNCKTEELNFVKKQRMDKLVQLIDERKALSSRLSVAAKSIQFRTGIPSESELSTAAAFNEKLHKEVKKRSDKYIFTRDRIKSVLNDLDKQVTMAFEKAIVFGDEETFVLSDHNMDMLKLLYTELENEYFLANEKRLKLESELVNLWDKLSIEQKERENFMRENHGFKSPVIKALNDEIVRCQRIKRQNLGSYVQKIRAEIHSWTERCYVAVEVYDDILKSCDFSDDLLEKHLLTLNKLKQYFNDHEATLLLINKWKSLFDRLVELDQKASDPNRWFNRGGALLLEEKERKLLSTSLPKIESEALRKSGESSKVRGLKFKVFNRSLREFFADHWTAYEKAKEREKKNKQKTRELEKESNLRHPHCPNLAGVRGWSGRMVARSPIKRPMCYSPMKTRGKASSNGNLAVGPQFGKLSRNDSGRNLMEAKHEPLNSTRNSSRSKLPKLVQGVDTRSRVKRNLLRRSQSVSDLIDLRSDLLV